MSRGLTIILGLLLVGGLGGYFLSTQESGYHSFKGSIYGTQYRVTYRPPDQLRLTPASLQAQVDMRLQRIDQVASSWNADSELSRLNQAHSQEMVAEPLSAELVELLTLSAELKEMTRGAFDVQYQGDEIDLSAIAKGYAVDDVCQYLQEDLGIDDLLVEIGGELKAHGVNPKGHPWTVAIYAPRSSARPVRPESSLRVSLSETSIATSGQYFHGKHIKDATTQQAASHELLSCSVLHPSSATADALATALFVMGPEVGLTWANQHKIKVLFLQANGTILQSIPWDD